MQMLSVPTVLLGGFHCEMPSRSSKSVKTLYTSKSG